MRKLAMLLVIIVAFVSGLYIYGTFPRKNSIDYKALQLTKLHLAVYTDVQGNTYNVLMPSFEGLDN